MNTNLCASPWELAAYWIQGSSSSQACDSILTLPISGPYVSFAEYLPVLLFTLLAESLIYLPALWVLSKDMGRALKASVLGNLATHLPLYWVFPFVVGLWNGTFADLALIGELWAIVGEWFVLCLFFRARDRWVLLAVSICANLLSWIGGLYLQ